MIILFPSEPFNPKEVDSSFKSEYEAAKLVGFEVFLFDHDEMAKTGNLISNLPKNYGDMEIISGGNIITKHQQKNGDDIVILRGWMLKSEHYACLQINLIERGYKFINDVQEYLNCHYFPEAYKHIAEYTSKAWWSNTWSEHPGFNNTTDVSWEPIRRMLGGDIIIKDYVKSEKGNPDLFILKEELTNEEFANRVQYFIDARGKLFNKGLVFKSVEKLKKYGDQTNEWRFFFINGKLLIHNQNSDNPIEVTAPSAEQIKLIGDVAKNIESNFFTIDIAEKEGGSWMILETGDGQVSGLPLKGDVIGFYNNMNNKLQKIETK